MLIFLIFITIIFSAPFMKPRVTSTLADYSFLPSPSYKPNYGHPTFSDYFNSPINSSIWFAQRKDVAWPQLPNWCLAQTSKGKLNVTLWHKPSYNSIANTWHQVKSSEVWSKSTEFPFVYEPGHFKYGYIEIKGKLARGSGNHNTFWLISFPNKYAAYEEVDIFEASSWGWWSSKVPNDGNYWNTRVNHFGSNHWRSYGGNTFGGNVTLIAFPLQSDDLSDNYNQWALRWTPFGLVYYFNNREIKRISREQLYDSLGIYDLSPKQIIIGLEYDNRIFAASPSSTTNFVDYVRLYQRKNYTADPTIYRDGKEINMKDKVCRADAYTYTTDEVGENWRIKWKIIDAGGVIIGSTTSKDVKVKFANENSRTMTLELNTLSNDGQFSERSIVITDRIDSHLFLIDYSCDADTKKISLGVLSNYKTDLNTTQSKWSIYKSNVDGDILSESLEEGEGFKFHFSNILSPDNFYLVKHGVKKSGCSDWSYSTRSFETRLFTSFKLFIQNASDAEYDAYPWRQNTNFHEPQVTHQWYLYESDLEMHKGKLLKYSEEFSPKFKKFRYGKYYLIRHEVVSACNQDHTNYYSERTLFMKDKNTKVYG